MPVINSLAIAFTWVQYLLGSKAKMVSLVSGYGKRISVHLQPYTERDTPVCGTRLRSCRWQRS
jgi:hypothetical protein